MATFSLGTSGNTPGAPGVYINEQAGNAALANLASFSTVYMLVETEETVSVTTFPFNTPIPVTSLADYRALLGGRIPEDRIPALSYDCVNEFFQNAQVGDLRVVRVGTPNQIVEIEFLSSGTKVNTTALPSALMAGDVVYVQMIINGLRLVSGDGSTGFTANGEWLGVPVTIPVNYIAGDANNNRRITAAIAEAVDFALNTNPAVDASVYVREYGLISDLNPTSTSDSGFITIAATTYDGNVSVVTEVNPVGANYVFMQNTYNISNIVGQSTNIERVPQDYTQAIGTAFDGQQDQGYLITPTAYAQFDAAGRALVGAAAANLASSANYKWMSLADPGPYLVTDINKYATYTPHAAAANLVTGLKYLVDNAIYQWTGTSVSWDKATYQPIVSGVSAEIPVTQSTVTVPASTNIGLLDSAIYNGVSQPLLANKGVYTLTNTNFWPVTLPIQLVTLGGATASNNDLYPYNGTDVYVVAPSYDPNISGTYPGDATDSYVFLTTTASAASAILTQINNAGGTAAFVASLAAAPTDAILPQTLAGTGSTFTLSYGAPNWDLPVTINGQTSDLVQNITSSPVGINTLHLPGTLQNPTDTYRLNFRSREISNPSVAAGGVSPYGSVGGIASTGSLIGGTGYAPGTYAGVGVLGGSGSAAQATVIVAATGTISSVAITTAGTGYVVGDVVTVADSDLGSGGGAGFSFRVATVVGQVNNAYTGAVNLNVLNHGLVNGQKIFFTQPILAGSTQLIKNTTKVVQHGYWVTVLDTNNFVLSSSLGNYTAKAFVQYINQPISSIPTVFYSNMLGGATTAANLTELIAVPLVRGRKYGLDSSTILSQAYSSATAPAISVSNVPVSLYLNTSSVILGNTLISPFGEDYSTAGWLPELQLTDPVLNPPAQVENAYCVPTLAQNFQSESFLVPALAGIAGGNYDANNTGALGPIATLTNLVAGAGYSAGTYDDVALVGAPTTTGYGATAQIVVNGAGAVTSVTITNAGWGYTVADVLTVSGITLGAGAGFTIDVATITATALGGELLAPTAYVIANKLSTGNSATSLQAAQSALVGVYFNVTAAGFAPDGTTSVIVGDRLAVVYNGINYAWEVIPAAALGGDLSAIGQVCFGAQTTFVFTPEQNPPAALWRFDAVTSTEIIDLALRGVGFNGVPQAKFIERGIDNVNALSDDSQRYFNPFGFIAYYGPWIQNGSGVFIPPSSYVTGVAIRRYRSEGYQFPPAGVKYQLADAVGTQIPINSAQQNLLNPEGCNAIRTLPGYPQTAVFIWGGRTRVNAKDAQQRLYQFVNTRVILNVVYGSLRTAFDTQIFNVIDGFGIVYNQIISVGNSILNQLYVRGALYGARPSDAFQVICDNRINPPESLENGIVNAKVFVTPVPTLERIQIDLIRVAIGQMQKELDIRGLGQNNS